jgi:hypothetical protein
MLRARFLVSLVATKTTKVINQPEERHTNHWRKNEKELYDEMKNFF